MSWKIVGGSWVVWIGVYVVMEWEARKLRSLLKESIALIKTIRQERDQLRMSLHGLSGTVWTSSSGRVVFVSTTVNGVPVVSQSERVQ